MASDRIDVVDGDSVLVDRRVDRTWVTLHRPAERNAIDAGMVEQLHDLCAELESDPKVLVLTGGSDGVFAGGADIRQLLDRRSDDALKGINLRLFERIRSLPMPTVAAIDGWALGGGAELAYACDIRVASARAKFGQPEPRLGILAGAGAAFRLVRLLGESVAKQILLAGRTLDAEDALRHGLVLAVTEPEDLFSTADGVVDTMVMSSAKALRLSKITVDAPAAAHPHVDLLAQAVLFEDAEKFQRMGAFVNSKRARETRHA
ncbi:enoyl-CoA hydratase/isomerase family protein [Mycobacterium lentiflavum]|uniref:Enoyl-CoA hydratase/isomerase family protein n=1 Tax=Mycobacterium lentiflavum TaxID=141349 RepID=A0ABY3UWT1_MYCLN|nr:enoyl-CoA hydratase/isomerase family protein [Mycobacterium lentiflavum]ULP41577.1 enoyl-CoA hydratase/isomerase family protein [Mycobacterium lentiflavum]